MKLSSSDRDCLSTLANSGPVPQGWTHPSWPGLYRAGYIEDSHVSGYGTPWIWLSDKGRAAIAG